MEKILLSGRWESWLDLFDYLFKQGYYTEDEIIPEGTTEKISITEIKARAFEEIYAFLPSRSDIDFVKTGIDLANTNDQAAICGILDEIPVRSK